MSFQDYTDDILFGSFEEYGSLPYDDDESLASNGRSSDCIFTIYTEHNSVINNESMTDLYMEIDTNFLPKPHELFVIMSNVVNHDYEENETVDDSTVTSHDFSIPSCNIKLAPVPTHYKNNIQEQVYLEVSYERVRFKTNTSFNHDCFHQYFHNK